MAIATEAARSPGPMGQDGMLRIRAERVSERTRLVGVEHRPPLQVTRAMYLDRGAPDLATVTIVSPAGGILQGDRLLTDIDVGTGARLSLGTQSATRVYRSPEAGARVTTRLTVAAGGYLEYLPDPWLPFADSRLDAVTTCVVDPAATLLVSESVMAGRVARGEHFALDRFESLVTVARPDGMLLARDCMRITRDEPPTHVGRFGHAAVTSTLIVVSPGVGPDLLRDAVEGSTEVVAGLGFGVSSLPYSAGAWIRVLGPDTASTMAVIAAARSAVRAAVLGTPPPPDRRP